MLAHPKREINWRGGYASTDVGRIHYREAGLGEPVVLLHGGQMDSTFWMRLAPILAERYRVLAIDWPTAGLSDPPAEEPEHLDFYGDAVVAFMDALGIERASLVGFHIGASIAVAAAAAHPRRVEKLSLLGLFAAETQAERDAFYKRFGFDFDDARVADPAQIVRDFMAKAAHSDDPDWYSAHLIARLRSGRRSWWAYRAIFRFDVVAAMRRVEAPTLIVHFDGDTLPAETARKGLEHMRGATWRSFDAEAYMPVTEPASLAAALADFLAG